jgi:hypothetical protein
MNWRSTPVFDSGSTENDPTNPYITGITINQRRNGSSIEGRIDPLCFTSSPCTTLIAKKNGKKAKVRRRD